MKGSTPDAERRGRVRRYLAGARPAKSPIILRIVPLVLLGASLLVVYARWEPWVHVRTLAGVTMTTRRVLSPVICTDGRVHDLEAGETLYDLKPPEGLAFKRHCLSVLSPDGRLVATNLVWDAELDDSPEARGVQLWEADTGEYVTSIPQQRGLQAGVVGGIGSFPFFSPDSMRIVTEDGPGRHIWDLETAARLFTLEYPCPFSPDSRLMAVSEEHRVSIVDGRTGERISSIPVPSGRYSVKFSPDGERLLVSLWDGGAQIVDLGRRRPVMFLPDVYGVGGRDFYSGDGKFVVSWRAKCVEAGFRQLATDQRTLLWDAVTGELVLDLYGCSRGEPTPDGRRLIGVTDNRSVGVWSIVTGDLLCRLPLGQIGRAVPVEGRNDALLAFTYYEQLAVMTLEEEYREQTVHYFRRRFPEWWWGQLCRPEVWASLVLAAVCLVQARIRSGRAQGLAPSRFKRGCTHPRFD